MARIGYAEINETLRASGLNDKEIDQVSTEFLATHGNYATKDQLEQYIKAYYFSRGMTEVKEAETTKEQLEPQVIDNNIDTENVNTTNIDKDKDNIEFPVPLGKDVRLNKKWPYNYQLHMIIESKKNIGDVDGMEFTNYLYENQLDNVNDFWDTCNKAKGKKPTSQRTKDKYIDFMIDSGYNYIAREGTSNGIVYKISPIGNNGYYTKISRAIIKTLLLCTNKHMAKLYAFMKCYIENHGNGFVSMDRSFLAREIGLSDKSEKNKDNITEMVTTLAQLGLIEIKRQSKKDLDSNGNKTYKTVNFYRICSYEEWKASRKRAQGITK